MFFQEDVDRAPEETRGEDFILEDEEYSSPSTLTVLFLLDSVHPFSLNNDILD